jgi:hypothetical protein
MPETLSRKSPVYREPCQQNRGKSYFFGKASRGAPAMASVKYPMTVRGAPSSIATKVTPIELSGSQGLSHYPGKDFCPPAHAFGPKSLCAKQSAALLIHIK